MKCISLWQPWASLIMAGAKTYETRSWPTGYRGPLVICAAKYWSKKLASYLSQEEFQKGLGPLRGRPKTESNGQLTLGLTGTNFQAEDLPFGAALGVVDLLGCRRTDILAWQEIAEEYSFGNYDPGRYAWKLENVRPFPSPIPMRGAQGLFAPSLEVLEQAQRLMQARRTD